MWPGVGCCDAEKAKQEPCKAPTPHCCIVGWCFTVALWDDVLLLHCGIWCLCLSVLANKPFRFQFYPLYLWFVYFICTSNLNLHKSVGLHNVFSAVTAAFFFSSTYTLWNLNFVIFHLFLFFYIYFLSGCYECYTYNHNQYCDDTISTLLVIFHTKWCMYM